MEKWGIAHRLGQEGKTWRNPYSSKQFGVFIFSHFLKIPLLWCKSGQAEELFSRCTQKTPREIFFLAKGLGYKGLLWTRECGGEFLFFFSTFFCSPASEVKLTCGTIVLCCCGKDVGKALKKTLSSQGRNLEKWPLLCRTWGNPH